MARFCAKYKTTHQFSTPYPQGNSQVEISNRIILDSLCKSLDKTKGKWVQRLPEALWAYRSTKRISTSETSFSLSYETEANFSRHLHTNIPNRRNRLEPKCCSTSLRPRSVRKKATVSSDPHCRLSTTDQGRSSQEGEGS